MADFITRSIIFIIMVCFLIATFHLGVNKGVEEQQELVNKDSWEKGYWKGIKETSNKFFENSEFVCDEKINITCYEHQSGFVESDEVFDYCAEKCDLDYGTKKDVCLKKCQLDAFNYNASYFEELFPETVKECFKVSMEYCYLFHYEVRSDKVATIFNTTYYEGRVRKNINVTAPRNIYFWSAA
jgi:hypothetical protein